MRSHDDRQTVIAMSRAGQSIRQIGRTLKMSPKTIRRILDGTAADHIQRPSRYQDLIPLIRELFVRFDGNVVSIQKELACQYGHNIPYTSLTHLVRNENLRPEKTKRSGTFLYLPGREAQHDTSAHQVTIGGKTVKAQCASMVLAIKHQYPVLAFDAAIARCLHYGVYDLDRLEKIILNLVAGDFFQLEPHEPDNP